MNTAIKTMACAVAAAMALGSAAEEFDLVIYGSSPAAISAAVQAGRMGVKAVVVSPETRIGGLTRQQVRLRRHRP